MRRPLALTVLVLAAAPACAGPLDAQRQAFRDAYAAAELGDWSVAESHTAVLDDYVLRPDLRAAWLRARLGQVDDAEVRTFLASHPDLRSSRDLRYRYALFLAREERHADYLALYRSHYASAGAAALDCHAARARLALGESRPPDPEMRRLWLVGHSQHDACDPLFEALRESGRIGPELLRERYALAMEAEEFRLARYLARAMDLALVDETSRWVKAQADPAALLGDVDPAGASAVDAARAAYAVRRLAYDTPEDARREWRRWRGHAALDAATREVTDRHVALWLARLGSPGARGALAALSDDAVDTEVRRWRVRTALKNGDWPAVIRHIESLPDEERRRQEWRYWEARALHATGDDEAAAVRYSPLAAERSYYGFLAADALGHDYALASRAIEADEAIIARLASSTALVRARELYEVGLEGRGRSEWDDAVAALDDAGRRQAALLAHRWGWHSRAIATAADAGDYDDLELRYPLPHRQPFEQHSAAAAIAPSWAYGIARSESLFMRDIRSRAGAIGVMQLLPSTGRRVASDLGHPYEGYTTLIDPDSNIRLGTHYLGSMQARFGGNPVLATAAYNAGPLRVEAWLPAGSPINTRVWVETIPYGETRRYVRRVLAAEVIFHWRLTGQTRRVSTYLAAAVAPAPADVPAAGR